MKILTGIDVPFQPFGGSLLCCNDWYSNLPEGVEVRFLTLPPPTFTKWWSIKDVRFMDIEKARTAAGFPDYLRRLSAYVQKEIEDFKPDVIHCQHLNFGLSRVFADIARDIPTIGICHGTDVQAALKSPFFMDNLTRICDAMDTLVFPNLNMYEDFASIYPKQKNYQISPLGIPDMFFESQRAKPDFDGQERLNVLYAGRLLDWKGADIAVEALASTRHDVHLTVIGNEDQAGYLQSLHDLVRKYNLQDKVEFLPQLPREELLDKFAKFDVIVFPSRKLEAFSLTVVEAQAKGLPVVFNPGGGIANTVGDSGLPLQNCTPQSLAKSLDYIYENPAVLAELQSKGYENAAQYKLSASRKRLFDLSRSIVQSRVN